MPSTTHTQAARKTPTMLDHLSTLERNPGRKGSLSSEEVAALLTYGKTHETSAQASESKATNASAQVASMTEALKTARSDVASGTRAALDARAIVARVVYVVTTQGPTGIGTRVAADLGISQGEVSKYKSVGAAMASARQTSGSAYKTFRDVLNRPKVAGLPSGKDALSEVVKVAQTSALASTTGETPKAGVRASIEDLTNAVATVLPPVQTAPEVPNVLKVTSVTRQARALADRIGDTSKASAFVGSEDERKYAVEAVRTLLSVLEGASIIAK